MASMVLKRTAVALSIAAALGLTACGSAGEDSRSQEDANAAHVRLDAKNAIDEVSPGCDWETTTEGRENRSGEDSVTTDVCLKNGYTVVSGTRNAILDFRKKAENTDDINGYAVIGDRFVIISDSEDNARELHKKLGAPGTVEKI